MNDYPKTVTSGGVSLSFRLMTRGDEARLLAFAKTLPPHDLLFLRRDVSNPKVVAAWIEAVQEGSIWTVLAERAGALFGCAAIVRDLYSWSPHVGEVRVLVSPEFRQKGLGRQLIQEAVKTAIGMGLKKLTAQMTIDQRGAVAIFEEIGFRGEALLKDHVFDRDGVKHDLAVLALDVDGLGRQHELFGVSSSLI